MQVFSINGQPCEVAEAKVPVTDHGFLYGDGVFEGLRFYRKRILKLGAHLDRLVTSARALQLALPMSPVEIEAALTETVQRSPHENGYIRLIVTRGVGPLGIDPRPCQPGSVIIIADQLSMVAEQTREQGAKLNIASTRRFAGDQLDSRIKSLNYLNQIMARLEANAAGADEAVVLNQQGFVAEGTADNIFIVRGGHILTPPIKDGALAGITRALVLDIAADLDIPVGEQSLTSFDLFTADECFLTGTGAELIPVREISGRAMQKSPGPIFNRVRTQFMKALEGDAVFS